MKPCTLVVFTNNEYKKYTCHAVRLNHLKWKKEFREKNGTDRLPRDPAYEEYCMEIDEFLENCKCEHPELQCNKCQPDDHEGYFCRCEGRNINLAKKLRELGIKLW